MRISDGSSDVCSSALLGMLVDESEGVLDRDEQVCPSRFAPSGVLELVQVQDVESAADLPSAGTVEQSTGFDIDSGVNERAGAQIGRTPCRERVGPIV